MNRINFARMSRAEQNAYKLAKRRASGCKGQKYANTCTPLTADDLARCKRTADEMLRRVDEIVRGGE